MRKLKKFFHKIPSRYFVLALVVAVIVSCITVSGTFASFQTTVIGTGETPVAAWNFQVKINNDFADSTSRISYISLAGDEYKTTKVKGSTDESNLEMLHTLNRDDSSILPSYILAPGTAGYMPVEIDGSAANVSVLVTIKAEFSYTNAFTYYDNLGRELTVTAESETDSVLVHNEDNSRDAEVDAEGKISTTYVGYITYNYYVSYQQVQKWVDGDFIDVGFRWIWAENDTTATEQMPKYIYSRITVTGAQVTNANQIKDSDMVINFVSQNSDFKYGNILNVLNPTTAAEFTAAPADGNFYLDVNAQNITEANPYKGFATGLTVNAADSYTGDIVLGTTRSQHGYPTTDMPVATVNAVNANTSISYDFKLEFVDILNNALKAASKANTLYDALKVVLDNSKATATLKVRFADGEDIADRSALTALINDYETAGSVDVVWNQEDNRFVEVSTTPLTNKYKYFKIYAVSKANAASVAGLGITQEYSIYLAGTVGGTLNDLTVGLDVGENSKDITSVTYDRSSASTAQSVVIRTNSFFTDLTINAPLDVVKHYGDAKSVNIIAVASTSYHEFGSVPFVEISSGRLIMESESDIKTVYLPTTKDADTGIYETGDVILATRGTATLPTLTRGTLNGESGDVILIAEWQKLPTTVDNTTADTTNYIKLVINSKTSGSTTTNSFDAFVSENKTTDKSVEDAKQGYVESQATPTELQKIEASNDYISTVSGKMEDDVKTKDTIKQEKFVEMTNYVARIGDEYYETLQDAVDAVETSETITLLTNIKTFTGIEQILNKDFTVDAGNKVEQNDYGTWISSGELYIMDNATGLRYYNGGKQVYISSPVTATDLYIPEGVEELVGMKSAVKAANLKNLYLPTSIKRINGRVFHNCSKLEKLYYKSGDEYVLGLPQTLTYLGESAFQSCTNLSIAVEIPDGIAKVCAGAFYDTAITAVTFNSNITGLGAGAFRACPNLTEVHLPASITTLGNAVFRDCSNLVNIYFDFEEVPATFEAFSFASVSGMFNNTVNRNIFVKNQDIADAMWVKLDSAAKANYTIKNIDDNSIVYYPAA